MKTILSTFAFFLAYSFCAYNMVAQNVMFVDFNKSYEEVIAELQALQVDTIELETKTRPLTAYYDGFEATYHFNHRKKLYKIEVVKNYAEQKVMKEAVKGAIEYFEIVSEEVKYSNNAHNKTQHVSGGQKDRKFEMEVVSYNKHDIMVTIMGIDSRYAPSQAYLEAHADR